MSISWPESRSLNPTVISFAILRECESGAVYWSADEAPPLFPPFFSWGVNASHSLSLGESLLGPPTWVGEPSTVVPAPS